LLFGILLLFLLIAFFQLANIVEISDVTLLMTYKNEKKGPNHAREGG